VFSVVNDFLVFRAQRLVNNFTTKSQSHKIFPFESLRLRALVVKKQAFNVSVLEKFLAATRKASI